MNRQELLLGTAGAAALSAASLFYAGGAAQPPALQGRRRLLMPPLIDATETGRCSLTAQTGMTALRGGQPTPTAGYNQSFLGPTLRLSPGSTAMRLHNALPEPTTTHWHGLLVPGESDGGPHQVIAPGDAWAPELVIDQPPCTAWYHPHIHRRTALQVHWGLAGVIHVSDGRDDARGLPSRYGIDDLTLVLQDRSLDASGRMTYDTSMMTLMHGATGEDILVNGQIGAVAAVPKAIARLRLVNGSNARIYSLFVDDGRPLHLVASEGGFLPAPTSLSELVLSPGERAEVLIDLTDGRNVQLMSGPDTNQGPNGMFGRMQRVLNRVIDRSFPVLSVAVDETLPARITALPEALDGSLPELASDNLATRRFSLDMGPQAMMGMMNDNGDPFAINGRAFDMRRIDAAVKLGTTERWVVESTMLQHPFHVHGASFQVVSEDGGRPRPQNAGWKDTVLVRQRAELLVRFKQPAPKESPFMLHCHILEHEDSGMMGQFTVS
ncbi:multicopper oxidase domain-containing protein [Afifella pfennigii]|uniref:multicopper oxidase domain-containing protein n=1 Tax=Afifella pfennigii TaxID=209897 RepID=UPI00047D2F79|nr:multicopper oxidase domain-containing protein [Afifella pfennigii]